MDCNFMRKMVCAQERTRNKKVKIHKKRTELHYPNYAYWNSQHFVFDK